MTKRRVRGAWRVAFECAGKYAPPGWREHISRGHARRVRGLSCDREASRNFNRPSEGVPSAETREPESARVWYESWTLELLLQGGSQE